MWYKRRQELPGAGCGLPSRSKKRPDPAAFTYTLSNWALRSRVHGPSSHLPAGMHGLSSVRALGHGRSTTSTPAVGSRRSPVTSSGVARLARCSPCLRTRCPAARVVPRHRRARSAEPRIGARPRTRARRHIYSTRVEGVRRRDERGRCDVGPRAPSQSAGPSLSHASHGRSGNQNPKEKAAPPRLLRRTCQQDRCSIC
jgi:hypothetical protein